MDSLRNSFEINLSIREAKSSGRTPTTIHAELGGTKFNISSTVPIVAEVYVESNSNRYKDKLELEPQSYKNESHESGSSRTKRSIDYRPKSYTESSTRTKRSLDFPSSSYTDSTMSRTNRNFNSKYKSDFKFFPMTTAVSLPGSSSGNEKEKDDGGITYPYNYEKEYAKLKAKEWKFDMQMKKKEERQIKEYYKQHEKMLESWQKLNDKQNSLWEKEREKERARKEELKRQREENEKRLHEEYLRAQEKKKLQMQQQQKNAQNDKSKKDNERENKTVK